MVVSKFESLKLTIKDKGTKKIVCIGKKTVVKKTGEVWCPYAEKIMKIYISPGTKINSKWIKGLNLRSVTVKLI